MVLAKLAEMTTADSPLPTLLTYAQASELLGVPPEQLHTWIHRKHIPHLRLGRRLVRFDTAALVEWMEASRVPLVGADGSSVKDHGTQNPQRDL